MFNSTTRNNFGRSKLINSKSLEKISIISAIATYCFALVVLSTGNILAQYYCKSEAMIGYGRIAARFVSYIFIIIICVGYFHIRLSNHSAPKIHSTIRNVIFGTILGGALFLFMLSENHLEIWLFTYFDKNIINVLSLESIASQATQVSVSIQVTIGLLVSCAIAPLAEEIFFRGLVFNALNRHFTRNTSIYILAGIFVMAHPQNPYVVGTLVFSIALSLAYLHTNSLWLSILAHGTFNFLSFLYENSFARFSQQYIDGPISAGNGWICFGIFSASSILLYFLLNIICHRRWMNK